MSAPVDGNSRPRGTADALRSGETGTASGRETLKAGLEDAYPFFATLPDFATYPDFTSVNGTYRKIPIDVTRRRQQSDIFNSFVSVKLHISFDPRV
jgi:hypothetical protein